MHNKMLLITQISNQTQMNKYLQNETKIEETVQFNE